MDRFKANMDLLEKELDDLIKPDNNNNTVA